ncbi:PH domain-containing protein blown fuse isoform 2-T3 [Cochliomyia hominivorax]
MFYMTASESTEALLKRCECLLDRLNNKNQKLTNIENTFMHRKSKHEEDIKIYPNLTDVKRNLKPMEHDDVSYLDMSANHCSKTGTPVKKILDFNSSGESDKTFRCSTLVVKQNKSFLHRLHDTMTTTTDDETDIEDDEENGNDEMNSSKDDTQIYDICQVTTQGSDGEEDETGVEETKKAITSDTKFSLPNIDCPYMDLPAGHLAIKKSIKYGQLMRIEKRLFFDQSKKYYCGILNDWLLCYADGPTSNKPTISLYLKIPSIEIEHFGEGKRRDVCFQITTCDPNKRFVFQAINEIDAKEWIHAIESAIRNDLSAILEGKNSTPRKLPTPPVMKKMTFLSTFQKGHEMQISISSNDCIYEEPSPQQQYITEKRPELPLKQTNTITLEKFEYDIPKCPPQPLNQNVGNNVNLINPYEVRDNIPEKSYLDSNFQISSSTLETPQKVCIKTEENLDFQAKVKDVHSKLTSQLTSGPKKSLKKTLFLSSQSEGEPLSSSNSMLPSPISPVSSSIDLKKQYKTPPNSPPKICTNEKSSFAKHWFLNRLNKTTSSNRSNSSSPSKSPSKSKHSEKENLLNTSSDVCDFSYAPISNLSNNPVSPILKNSSPNTSGTSKVNMIINQLEASGHLASMFSVDAVASFNSFCDNDCNNYEPIMTVSTPHSNLMKKV